MFYVMVLAANGKWPFCYSISLCACDIGVPSLRPSTLIILSLVGFMQTTNTIALAKFVACCQY
jgi:hypothetical protein